MSRRKNTEVPAPALYIILSNESLIYFTTQQNILMRKWTNIEHKHDTQTNGERKQPRYLTQNAKYHSGSRKSEALQLDPRPGI